ncbi:MAG: pyridoxal-phosphate dependent enzyme [Bradymonadia bacterium]
MIPQHHYLSCVGCGTRVFAYDAELFSCPNVDVMPECHHILQRKHVINKNLWQRRELEDSQNPFIRYRHRLLSYHRTMNTAHADRDYLERVEALQDALIAVDGRGFNETPASIERDLAKAIGLSTEQSLLVKNETINVAGSHKGRHLFGILLNLAPSALRRELAIASCGNAALAAAVIAKAAGAKLKVFIPTNAEDAVVELLQNLGAELQVSERREGESGDPCYRRFVQAVKAGALPFTCQGPDNGLTIEGGSTLAYELFDQMRALLFPCHHMFIQVGGGALASSTAQALADVMRYDPLPYLPRLHTVQTQGAFPLARAYDRVVALINARLNGEPLPELHAVQDDMSVEERAAAHNVEAIPKLIQQADCIRSAWDSTAVQSVVRIAAAQKHRFMWPWEATPQSVAHGILDDETYDWFAVLSTMLRSGGIPIVATEAQLKQANALAKQHSSINPSATGSAGLAGLIVMQQAASIASYENIALLFTGIDRG